MKESVKIDSTIVQRIREHVKGTGQTIGGFADISLKHTLDYLDREKEFLNKNHPELMSWLNKKNKRTK
jgi:hypothetical protein